MKIKKFISLFHDFAPQHLAEKWDSIGLQIGNPETELSSVLFALQLDGEVLEEALEKGCNLIFVHHPFIFQPVSSIDTSSEKGRVIMELLKNEVSVFAAHTNLDAAKQGLNHNLGEIFDFSRVEPLGGGHKDQYTRIVVYYPDDDSAADYVKKVLESGNTRFGEYTKCGFFSAGTGCFEPSAGAAPATGNVLEFNTVKEIALEFIVDSRFSGNVLQVARSNHPYEFPMIITHSINYPVKESYALGRVGYFDQPMDFMEILKFAKDTFKQQSIRYSINHSRRIKKVGIVGGSGISMMTKASSSGCDLFVTGDLKHHDWDLAKEIGLSVIEISHFVMEELAFKIFFDDYQKILLEYSVDCEYSERCRENFNYY